MLRFIIAVYLLSGTGCLQQQSRHKRAWIIDSFSMEEGHPGPFPYELGKIDIERAYRVNFDLYGEGVDEEPKGVLSIDKENGIIYVHKPVDYEEKELLTLKFEAKKSDLSLDTKLGIQITVIDINDNPPLFQRSLYEITTQEDTAQGSFLLAVLAHDRDQRGSLNSTFHYELKSVSPQTENIQFFVDKEIGKISFKGCLDHEVADKFTLLVEAKDHGDVISLSSSTTVVINIQDGNNHLPIISGQTGSGKVKEGETGTSPLRIHVTDMDSPNSPAWRVKYTITGEDAKHFKMETDLETNDGLLTVLTPLDYEEMTKKDLTIMVENEAPFFHCTVKEKLVSGLWAVDMVRGEEAVSFQTVKVTIEVEDVNDPPAFLVAVKEVILQENSSVGTWVGNVTAHDPDSRHARDFVYKVGDDPAGWVKVDPKTGDIITVKVADHESSHVVNGIYTVLIYAVDNGEPQMTGTATVNIYIADQNDNVPQLEVDSVDVCLSDDITTTNITAFDLDENPFGGPFTFELLGDVQDKWTLSPSFGYTAGLVKESGVFAGPYTVSVKVMDKQGEFAVYNLNVIVCDCSLAPNCRIRRENAITMSSGAVGLVFFALLLLFAGLLLALLVTCKKEFTPIQFPDSEGTTLASYMEGPGTDCMVPLNAHTGSTDEQTSKLHDRAQHFNSANMNMIQNTLNSHYTEYSEQFSQHFHHHHRNQWVQYSDDATGEHLYKQGSRETHFTHRSNSESVWNEAVLTLLQRRLTLLRETEDELLDYEPHLYTEEGDEDGPPELENISIPETDSFHNVLHLTPEFRNLAYICRMHLLNGSAQF